MRRFSTLSVTVVVVLLGLLALGHLVAGSPEGGEPPCVAS